jgi:3-oxoacyl-(acyl-carrier-protein) synthase
VAAERLIACGVYSSVIVAGVDVQSRFITSGFSSFKSVSESVCRPYDSSRDGLNPGEACGAMLLKAYGPQEKLAGKELPDDAVIISGGAISNDANHITGPSRTGDGLYFAIRNAMSEAMVSTEEISFLQMHGTATLYNDEMESKAAALAGLGDVPAQSLKPYFGHTMGASGLIESIICAEELRRGIVFGTKGFSESGVTCPLDVSSHNRNVRMEHCIKTASGFGGSNAAIVLSLNRFSKEKRGGKEAAGVVSLRRLAIRKNRMDIEDNTGVKVSKSVEGDFGSFIRCLFNERGGAYMKFYKMDNLSKLGYVASDYLIGDLEYDSEEMAVLLENRSGSLDTDIKHQQIIDNESDESASPAVFVYTLPNVSSGEISIAHHIKGENTFFISGKYDPSALSAYARILFSETEIKYCIIGWLELLGEDYCAEMELLQKK